MSGTVAIVGGGIVGSMAALFLRRSAWPGRVVVLERDPSYAFCSTARSAAAIRTQFGCPVNVRMSLFGFAFLKSVQTWLGADVEIGLRAGGYLILGTEAGRAVQLAAARMQIAAGAEIDVLDRDALRARFPWLNVEDVGQATFGRENEGWFDAWALLLGTRAAARRAGAEYVHAAADGFVLSGDRIGAVTTACGERIAADWVVLAAGPASGRVAALLGIDLPVSARKRTVFHFRAPLDGARVPMTMDCGGVWMRPEGDGFIAGISPAAADDPEAEGDFEPDHDLFEAAVWPAWAHRVPALRETRLMRAWAGHYEVNALDQNGVVGPHDQVGNLVFATGFSGHGVQHAPATGRAVAELIVHGGFRTLDLSPLGWARVRAGRPMVETAVW